MPALKRPFTACGNLRPMSYEVFLIAAAVATVVAYQSMRSRPMEPPAGQSQNPPNWAIRFYLCAMAVSGIPFLQRYAKAPRANSTREGFLVAWFLTFIVVAFIGTVVVTRADTAAF
jgi:hypothetical protein